MTAPGPGDARLQRLVAANESIVADLDLPTVLRRIVEAALELIGARYGALGVVAPDRLGLEQFVHVGVDDDVIDRIGHLPEGKGLLGALIEDPHPIRLPHLAGDPRSVGFPAGHPPMDSFLGVPIRVRGEVYGNLYLTDSRAGQFDAEDEAIAVSLAATAGIAIHNARLYTDSGRRQQWLLASSDLTRRVLADASSVTPALVARTVRTLAGSVAVAVLEVASAETATVTAVAGDVEGSAVGAHLHPPDALHRTIATGDARAVDVFEASPGTALPVGGPAILLPLLGSPPTVLVALREPGARPFTGPELEMASTFATQVSVALELARAREDQQRMALLEDRARIARDLHDHVIQQLFAAGMSVQGIASTIDDPDRSRVLGSVVDTLDEAVRQVRTSIFQLRSARPDAHSLRSLVLDVAREVAEALGFDPDVSFDGPVDAVGTGDLGADVVAVVREALTNVARHAGAGAAVVRLRADAATLSVEVADDGRGVSDPTRHSGLSNLEDRAQRRDGSCVVGAGPSGVGTLLIWSVPVA